MIDILTFNFIISVVNESSGKARRREKDLDEDYSCSPQECMPFQWKMFDLATFAMFAMKTICLVDMFPVSLQIPISKSLPVAKVNFTGKTFGDGVSEI